MRPQWLRRCGIDPNGLSLPQDFRVCKAHFSQPGLTYFREDGSYVYDPRHLPDQYVPPPELDPATQTLYVSLVRDAATHVPRCLGTMP